MYSREQIQQVRSSVDIVNVIREYVPSLKVAGRSVRGLCPFHTEKTPSFHVHPEKGLFKCFGCGQSGDVIAFLTQIEQVSFSEALERLAKEGGIRLEKAKSYERRQEESIQDKLYKALEAATNFYEECLWSERLGQEARSYLSKRGVTEETTKNFRLGYAPTSGQSCFETLVKKGHSIEICQKAGLVSRSKAGRYYDPLFGRLIFPIFDHFGHNVGVGGRILPQTKKNIFGDGESDEKSHEGPKYLNSPETPVFSKGKLLYGLPQAKPSVMKERRVLILEGYMDVIGAHQAGYTKAVATLGTALTRDHAKLLKRYSDEVVAFFDPDEAGQKAALRGLEPILQESLFPKVVLTRDKLDPDEMILQKGLETFEELVDEAPDFVDYMIAMKIKGDSLSIQEKTQLAQSLVGVISHSPNEILKTQWMHQISKKLTIPVDALGAELKKVRRYGSQPEPKTQFVVKKRLKNELPTAEEEYIQLLCGAQETWNDLGLDVVDFSEKKHQQVFTILKRQIAEGKLDLPSLHDELPEEDKSWFLELTTEQKNFMDPIQYRDQLIRDIRIQKGKKRLAALSKQIAMGQASHNEREEYRDLLRQIKGSSRPLAAQ